MWSFAEGKTPEVNPHSGFTTGTPAKPGFLRLAAKNAPKADLRPPAEEKKHNEAR
jgi:hypothetical protein